MIHVILIIFLGCLCAFWFSKKSVLEPPNVSGRFPIIINLFFLIIEDHYKLIKIVSEKTLKNGGLITLQLGFKKCYFVTDPEALMILSNICLDKEAVYKFTKPILGEALITGDVPTWKKHRKLLSPCFNQQVINSFIDTFNSQARKLVDSFAEDLAKPFDHKPSINRLNLETICSTATGVCLSDNSSLQENYLLLVQEAQQIFNYRLRVPWLHNDFIYNLSATKQRQDKLVKQYLDFSKSIIKQKKAEFNTKNKSKERAGNKTFLEHILDVSQKSDCLTDDEVREETDTIIGAGHDTTATTLNVLFIVLGSHPEVQKKVYNEIVEVLGETDINKDDLSKFVYTEAVLKETLRLYPVVPVVARLVKKDIQIKNFTLKKNSTCILSLYGVNRHADWGQDADQFRPERWLDALKLPDMNNFGTFSFGKRNCIGKLYAMVFMKIIVIHVIRRYKITSDLSKLVIKWHMTAYPASGRHFTLKLRDVMKK